MLENLGVNVWSEADKAIDSSAFNTNIPSSLFLMGDLIYSDDVADPNQIL